MMNDLATIKIGDGEDLARSVSRKYDGYRRDQQTLIGMYEKPDYQYVVQVDPCAFLALQTGHTSNYYKFNWIIGAASTAIAPSHRKEIGLRRWSVIGIVSVSQKHV